MRKNIIKKELPKSPRIIILIVIKRHVYSVGKTEKLKNSLL